MTLASENKGKGTLTVLFGLFGVIVPFGAVYVATFLGKTDMASFNSTMMMLLSVLLIVFLVINCFSNFNDNHKKIFILGLLFLLLSMISFIWNLIIFVTL
ncbi:MAG: hypothetical protein WC462_02720 [archaeon]